MSVPPHHLSDFERLLERVESRVGLKYSPAQWESAWVTISRAMKNHGFHELNRYRVYLEKSPETFNDLVNELTVGETYFFRNPAQFQMIQDHILPEILARVGPETIHVWSAACSSGEEPYSLAILFREMTIGDRVEIFASDISQSALARAKEGRYRNWSLREDYQGLTARYLKPNQSDFVLDSAIKNRVRFGIVNLVEPDDSNSDFPTQCYDLILCRNVLIYFREDTVQRVAEHLFDRLEPGGWLLLGAADPPIWDAAPFETLSTDQGIFYRRPLTEDSDDPENQQVNWNFEIPIVKTESVIAPSTNEDPPKPSANESFLADAWKAHHAGNEQSALDLVASHLDNAAACVLHVRALANEDPEAALRDCEAFSEKFPTSVELHYLHGLLLMDHNRTDEAIHAMKRVLFLDRSLVVVHYTLGMLSLRQSERDLAVRFLENARNLCVGKPPAQLVPFTEGETMGHLLESIQNQLRRLERDGS